MASKNMQHDFTATQKRALAVATVLALVAGAVFLRTYFTLIVVGAVAAYLFGPLYARLRTRMADGWAAATTLFAALLMLVIPVTVIVAFAVVQISAMVTDVSGWLAHTDVGALGDRTLRYVNDFFDRVPFLRGIDVTPQLITERAGMLAQKAGAYLLGVLQGAAGGVLGGLTAAVLFLYVFLSLLRNHERVRVLIGQLNPLGEEVTDLYLAKMGAMVKGTVRGQFVIALAQGLSGALSIYIGGLHQGFFIFALLLTALSVIPLGGGILSVPLGVGMALFDNVFGGIFVIAFHLLVVTNIDNVLRPILVPRQARLDSALMLLAVFAGIATFGFWGLVIGPVIMIVIVTTISVYRAVYKGVPLDSGDDDEPKSPGRLQKWVSRLLRRRSPGDAKSVEPGAEPTGESVGATPNSAGS